MFSSRETGGDTIAAAKREGNVVVYSATNSVPLLLHFMRNPPRGWLKH
jgi:hypothetical protein